MTPYWEKQMNHELTRLYYERLVEIIKELRPLSVLEVGTGWGISGSAFMDCGVPLLVTIDASTNPDYLKVAHDEIETHKTDGQKVFYNWMRTQQFFAENETKFDMVFIDGDHSYEGAKFDLDNAVLRLNPGGHIVMDDYLHEANFVFDDRNCGVSKAAREYLMTTGKRATIVPHNLENGFLII